MPTSKEQILAAMKAGLEAKSWDTTTPEIVIEGPIPAGQVEFPCISVLSTDWEETEHSNLAIADVTCIFVWNVAQSLDLGELSDQWKANTAWAEEATSYARKAIDFYWGLGGLVRASEVLRGRPSVTEIQDGEGNLIEHLLTTAIEINVSYHEAIS